jgi:phosphatidylethanolamine/phosphatidyl-N-methylethanolamine N-methyltransferase
MVFPAIFAKRILKTLRGMVLAPGSRVLELGVGTGISLDAYPRHCQIMGVDLNEEMLDRASQKVEREGWTHVELKQMNAENLEFPSATFDLVCAFHLITVVKKPEAVMREIVRVCRPGGTVLLINHFRSPIPWIAKMVDTADPVTRRLGWRTDLACSDLIEQLPLKVDRCYKYSPMSLFTIVKAERLETDSA